MGPRLPGGLQALAVPVVHPVPRVRAFTAALAGPEPGAEAAAHRFQLKPVAPVAKEVQDPAWSRAFDAAAADLPPGPALAAGYTLRTFGPKFGAMFAWNWFGETPDTVVTNADGTITIFGNGAGANAALASAKSNTGAPLWFNGAAFGGGGYFEAEFRMSPVSTANLGGKVPAWWSLDVDHSIENNALINVQWPGQASNYNHWIEPDFIEYNSSLTNKYGGAIHDWYGLYSGAGEAHPSFGSPFTVSGDMSSFHKYGFLWIPATASTSGTAQFFYDGAQVGTTVTWSLNNDAGLGPPPSGTQIASVLDNRHLMVILGNSGASVQMVVRSVNVWQSTTVNNLYQ